MHTANSDQENYVWVIDPTLTMLNWAITFLLLGFVSTFLMLVGTGSEIASLFARLSAVGFLAAAAAVFLAYARHRNRHPGAS
jgi:hypothetical protein